MVYVVKCLVYVVKWSGQVVAARSSGWRQVVKSGQVVKKGSNWSMVKSSGQEWSSCQEVVSGQVVWSSGQEWSSCQELVKWCGQVVKSGQVVKKWSN